MLRKNPHQDKLDRSLLFFYLVNNLFRHLAVCCVKAIFFFISGNTVCKLIMFIPKFIIISAISTIVAIAADRYRVMIYQKHLFKKGALISVGIIWLTAACFSAPQVYEYNVYEIMESGYNRTLVS